MWCSKLHDKWVYYYYYFFILNFIKTSMFMLVICFKISNFKFVLSAKLCLPYKISTIPMLLSTRKSSWSNKKGKKNICALGPFTNTNWIITSVPIFFLPLVSVLVAFSYFIRPKTCVYHKSDDIIYALYVEDVFSSKENRLYIRSISFLEFLN